MKITIVTVCLNAEETIRDCLRSVSQQDYKNIEYIVIDGGSKDSTVSIVKSFNLVDYLISEQDDGLYDAMNKAVKKASGDYILFLNADDYLVDETVISRSVEKMTLNFADIYYGNIIVRLSSGSQFTFRPPNQDYLIGAMSIYCLPHQAMFSAKGVFESCGGFSMNYKILSDYEWYLKAFAMDRKFSYIDVDVASFSYDGLSSNPERRMNEFFLIQNSSPLYSDGKYDYQRIFYALGRITELKQQNPHLIHFMPHQLQLSKTLTENLLILQREIMSLENLA